MYEECCFECSLIVNNLIGLLQFILGIYEIIILSKFNGIQRIIDDRDTARLSGESENRRIYYFIFFKSTINIVYGCMLIIYNLYCFKTKNKIIKFTNYYSYIIGIWGFFEWVFANNINNYYLGILFMEFMIFQFRSSMFLLECCINCYFHENIIIINNFENSTINTSITPIINITNDNISLVDVTQNTINIPEDVIAKPINIVVESYKFEEIGLT
jgi:hypothetical protein